ncbi:MAG: hypothetical protein RL510_512, partial [Actinomycetota bacterium]
PEQQVGSSWLGEAPSLPKHRSSRTVRKLNVITLCYAERSVSIGGNKLETNWH